MKLRFLQAGVLCLVWVSGSVRAAVDIETLAAMVEQQAVQIAKLTKALEATQARLDATVGQVTVTQEQLVSTADFVESMSTARGSTTSWTDRTSVGGYGEMHYNDIDARDSARDLNEVDYHRYVLFFNHEFSPRVRFFSELEIEHSLVKDTADGSNNGEVEVEQAYIEMDLRDNLQAKAGLFLLPIGLLNETHEPTTFYGVERNDVENIIIPSTWWEGGFALSGQHAGGLSWDLAVHSGLEMPTTGGSAFRVRSGRQKVSNASAADLAFTGRIRYTGVPGLELAASYQHQQDASQLGGDGLDAADLLSMHVAYSRGPFSLRALWAQWDFDGDLVAVADVDEQTGWYIEPSVRFGVGEAELGFYSRYEDLEGARSRDQFDQWEVGLNFWPTSNVVLKMDYRDREHDLASDAGRDFKAIDLGVGYQF